MYRNRLTGNIQIDFRFPSGFSSMRLTMSERAISVNYRTVKRE